MAATFEWNQDTGTQTGSPLKGTTRTTAVTNCNWKNSGVIGDAYSSFPVVAGTNSFGIYQFGKFTGTFNTISNAKVAHTAGTCGTGVTLAGLVTSTYATPSATAVSGTSDWSTAISVGSGTSINFSTTGPEAASPTSTLTAAGYTQFIVTQLQTTGSAGAGDISSLTVSLQFDES